MRKKRTESKSRKDGIVLALDINRYWKWSKSKSQLLQTSPVENIDIDGDDGVE